MWKDGKEVELSMVCSEVKRPPPGARRRDIKEKG
jgi:hypothetical protein